MASRALLKLNLPLRFLRNTRSLLTRSVAPVTQYEAPHLFTNKFAALGITEALFVRQMATSRSSLTPRGSRNVSDDEDDGEFDDDVVDFDDDKDDDESFDLDAFDDIDDDDDDDDEEEEEVARPKKKSSGKK